MPKRIPIKVAKEIAKSQGCRQVIIVAWDGEKTHVVTYGSSVEDCAQAAEGGNLFKEVIGWPKEMCNDQPSRVKKLNEEISRLKMLLAFSNGKSGHWNYNPIVAMQLKYSVDEILKSGKW